MTQTIRIEGIRAEGRHGARAGERDRPQRFEIDVELEVDARDDDLATTADYHEVVESVRELVETTSVALIETLAERIADQVRALPGVRRCRVGVHKPRAADRLRVDDVVALVRRDE